MACKTRPLPRIIPAATRYSPFELAPWIHARGSPTARDWKQPLLPLHTRYETCVSLHRPYSKKRRGSASGRRGDVIRRYCASPEWVGQKAVSPGRVGGLPNLARDSASSSSPSRPGQDVGQHRSPYRFKQHRDSMRELPLTEMTLQH